MMQITIELFSDYQHFLDMARRYIAEVPEFKDRKDYELAHSLFWLDQDLGFDLALSRIQRESGINISITPHMIHPAEGKISYLAKYQLSSNNPQDLQDFIDRHQITSEEIKRP